MRRCGKVLWSAVILVLMCGWSSCVFANPIRIALNLGFSGVMAGTAQQCQRGAEIAVEQINQKGGIKIPGGGEIELVITDNFTNATKALPAVTNNIIKDKVIAIVGPYASNTALGIAGLANGYKTPMIIPSTMPKRVVAKRPYIFKIGSGVEMQASLTAKFVQKKWQGERIAVLYDELDKYSFELANGFKKTLEKERSVDIVAFESFRGADDNFDRQLEIIQQQDPALLYFPQSPQQLSLLVEEMKRIGLNTKVLASNWANDAETAEACGEDCEGISFAANFIAGNPKGNFTHLVNSYQKKYGKAVPEAAAAAYDAINRIAAALQKMSALTGNIHEDRKQLREAFAALDFVGAAGKINYKGSGEAERCLFFSTIKNGVLSYDNVICP